jgi:hypothetical protein
MQVIMHSRLMMVADFMQKNIETHELQPIAEALGLIAPALWGHYDSGSIIPLSLCGEPIESRQSVSTEFALGSVGVDGDSVAA